MTWPVIFGGLSSVPLQDLDTQFGAVGDLTPIPCTVAGTNTLTFVPNNDTPDIAALSNYMQFTGIAAHTNSSSVTAAIGSLSPLNIYKDTPAGPVALVGNEIVAGCAIILIYDSALNSGAGGFHLQPGASVLVGQTITVAALILGTGAALTRLLSRQATITHTVVPANTTQDQTATLSGLAATDVVCVAPPASAGSVAGLVYTGYVSAAGTVGIRCANVTAASIVPPTSQVFRITAFGFT